MSKTTRVMGVLSVLAIFAVFFIAASCGRQDVEPSGDFCIPDINGVCKPVTQQTTATPVTTTTDIKDLTDASDKTTTAVDSTTQNVPRLEYNASQLIDLKARLRVKNEDNNVLTYTFSAPFDKDGKWQTSAYEAGEYLTTIAVSDGFSIATTKVLVIVKAQNRAPAIGKMADVIVSEGEKVILNPIAVDPDGDVLQMTYSGWMTNKEYITKYGDSGDHFVTITASDGKEKAVQIVKVIVKKANQPPKLDQFNDVSVQEGDKVTIVPKASDPDNDPITLSYSAPFNVQGIWQTKEGDNGVYRINVTASDGSKSVTQTFSLVVKGKNRASQFVSLPDQKVNESKTLSFTVAATDPENDVVTIIAKELPTAAGVGASFDTITRKFTWTPNYDTLTASEGTKKFSATFEASDGTNKVTYTVPITVVNTPRQIEIVW